LLTSEPETAAVMGEKSLHRIKNWNFEADCKGLLAALKATVDDSAPTDAW